MKKKELLEQAPAIAVALFLLIICTIGIFNKDGISIVIVVIAIFFGIFFGLIKLVTWVINTYYYDEPGDES